MCRRHNLHKVAMDNHLSKTPHKPQQQALADELVQHMLLTTERHTTSLDCHMAMSSYYSEHERDSHLGSMGLPYSCQWTGNNLVRINCEQAEKAIRWAVHSAIRNPTLPTLTVLVITRKRGFCGYERWLDLCKSTVQRMFTVTTEEMGESDTRKHSKLDVIMVANTAGADVPWLHSPHNRQTMLTRSVYPKKYSNPHPRPLGL